jgi:hypothetical protein
LYKNWRRVGVGEKLMDKHDRRRRMKRRRRRERRIKIWRCGKESNEMQVHWTQRGWMATM